MNEPPTEGGPAKEAGSMSHSEKALKVYQQFQDHLTAHNFEFDTHDDDLVITLTVHGDSMRKLTIIRVLDDRDLVQVISPSPSKVSEEKRIDGAIAVAVANYGMVNGSFDYDMNDGEIRFRVTQSYRDTELSDELIGYMLRVTFATTDKYNSSFYLLGKGLISLEQFIEKENAK